MDCGRGVATSNIVTLADYSSAILFLVLKKGKERHKGYHLPIKKLSSAFCNLFHFPEQLVPLFGTVVPPFFYMLFHPSIRTGASTER